MRRFDGILKTLASGCREHPATKHPDQLAEVYPLKVFPDAVGLAEKGRENLLPYGNIVFNAFGPGNDLFHQAMAKHFAGSAIDG
jgi:hypothetical protein